MSEDKVIIKLELDKTSVDNSLDKVGENGFAGLDKSIARLNESIDALSSKLSGSSGGLVAFQKSVEDINTSTSKSTGSISGLSMAVSAMAASFYTASGALVGTYNFFQNAPGQMNLFVDRLIYVLTVMKDIIKFSDLDKYPFLNKAPELIDKITFALEQNRSKMIEMIDSYKRFNEMRSTVISIVGGFTLAIQALVVSVGVSLVALAGFFLYLTRDASQSIFLFVGTLSMAFSKIKTFFSGLPQIISGFFASFKGVFQMVANDLQSIGAVLGGNTKTLYGLADVAQTIASKLVLLSVALHGFDGDIVNLVYKISATAAVLTTVFAVAIAMAIFKVAHLGQMLGSYLVEQFQKSYHAYTEFRKETIAFTSVIEAFNKETQGAVGTTEEWSAKITELSKTLNFSQKDLKKAAAEVVSVGTRLELTREQTEKLLDISAAYARITGKDVYDSTVAFASALQGNAQAVLGYGVKLSEASNAHYAFKSGMEETFTTMSDNEKTQVRFNNLLSQYNVVSGVAANIANDWFSQNQKLSITMENLNAQVGLGAAYVEDLNLGSYILNNILSVMPDSVARLSGLFGAFGARMIQLAGFFVESSFKLFLLYRGFQLLDALLKTNSFNAFATKTLPFLNNSLLQTVKNLGVANASFAGLKPTLTTLGTLFTVQKANIMAFIFGISAAGSTTGGLMSIVATRISGAFTLITTGLRMFLVSFGPIVLIVGAVVGSLVLLYKAFENINEQTQVFALVGESFNAVLSAVFGTATGLSDVLNTIGYIIKNVLGTAFGFLIYSISQTFSIILKIAADVSSVFSKKVSGPLEMASKNLDNLNNRLQTAGFNFMDLGETALASSAKVERFKFTKLEDLNTLLQKLKEDSKGELEKIASENSQRMQLISDAVRGEVLLVSKAEEAKSQIRLITAKATQDALSSMLGFSNKETEKQLVEDYNKRQGVINNALNLGLINQKQYNDLKVKNETELSDKMDELAKKQSNSTITEQDKIRLAYSITAEQADRAMKIMAANVDATTKIMSNSLQMLGASLMEGPSAFKDFRSMVLNILGDFAIQVGTIVMGIGAAANAVAVSLATFFGTGAIIAGAALIVLGGALKSMSAGAGASTPTGPVGTAGGYVGPNSSGTTANPDLAPRPDAKRDVQNPNVVINIEGSLYSTEDTGRTLVDLISKEFDKTGAQIRRRGFV